MRICGRLIRLMCLALLGGMEACAGPGVHKVQVRQITYYPSGFDPAKDPYWEDPRWDKTLLDAAQSAVHNPVDPADTSTPGLHAVVKFTYQDGTAEYPEIVQSTGDTDRDELLLHQLASAQLPQTSGVDTDKPHVFVLDLNMPTPFESFQTTIYNAIDNQKVYPKDAVIEGAQGITTVGFDYADGKATDIAMTKSSNDKDLDDASVGAVTKAVVPAPPAIYAGKTFHMELMFCYALYQSYTDKNRCPESLNVILVTGIRIRRVGF